jgi:hypothetical protein
MAKAYKPRRAGARWMEGAPAYILDVFDEPTAGDRYTILFSGEFVLGDGTYAGTSIQYLGCNAQPTHPAFGVSMWGEFSAYDAARFRYARGHRRVRWLDLPEHIREHVQARATFDPDARA